MEELSVLIGGKAGDGINSAGMLVAHLFNRMGYHVYMYFDYPSLIKGGHNFAIVRTSRDAISAHREKVDFILALDQNSVDLHRHRVREETMVIYDQSRVRAEGIGVDIPALLKEEGAPPVMGNSCIIGSFARAAGIEWGILEEVFTRQIPKALPLNIRVARRGYEEARECCRIAPIGQPAMPVISGNEAIGLGLIHGGLDAYVAYPMTPTSNLLHFMAEVAKTHDLIVFHPENEIAVMLMALGLGYAGKRTAVGTSGGGFCLMTEGLSLAGMSEIPVVMVLGQRAGPSTGMPTYTAQSDLHFALHAGQGEFIRLVTAPGDAVQAYEWSSRSLQIAWDYQVPAIILCDKTLCEGFFSFDEAVLPTSPIAFRHPGNTGPGYLRYQDSGDGISGMLFPPAEDTVIKVNSYTHDQAGLSTEKAELAGWVSEKRQRKGLALANELAGFRTVETYGNLESEVAVVCWGSTLGVCREVAAGMGLRVVQPVVLSPLPVRAIEDSLKGVRRKIVVEENMDGQLAMLLACHGIGADLHIRRYDGRPFSVEELESRVREVLA